MKYSATTFEDEQDVYWKN